MTIIKNAIQSESAPGKQEMQEMPANKFLKEIADCVTPTDDLVGRHTARFSAITVLSCLFPRARLHDNQRRAKTLNIMLGIVAPPASGKGLVSSVIDLLIKVRDHVKSMVSTANLRSNFPEKTVLIPGNVTKTRLHDHLKVNSEALCPSLVYESETSTLIKAMGGPHGDFRDTMRRIAENEIQSYSRKTNNLTIFIDYPYLTILLAGTPDQAKSMYETDSGTFSRFLYYIINQDAEYRDLPDFEKDGTLENLGLELLQDKLLKLYLFYKDSDIVILPDAETLKQYNQFAKDKMDEFKATFKADKAFGFRYVFSMLKIAGIYALLRIWLDSEDEVYTGDAKLYITSEDLQLALQLDPHFWVAHTYVYSLVKQVKANPLQAVLDKLNSTFTRSDYVAAQATIAAKSHSCVTDDLKKLIESGYLKKVMRDNYQKL